MTLRDFLLAIAGVSALSWTAWITVVFYIDPTVAGTVGVVVFYVSLVLSLIGTFVLIGLGVRILGRRLNHQEIVAFRYIAPSIRQAVWFSLLIVISLLLLASGLFAWWSALLLLIALAGAEAFFLLKYIET